MATAWSPDHTTRTPNTQPNYIKRRIIGLGMAAVLAAGVVKSGDVALDSVQSWAASDNLVSDIKRFGPDAVEEAQTGQVFDNREVKIVTPETPNGATTAQVAADLAPMNEDAGNLQDIIYAQTEARVESGEQLLVPTKELGNVPEIYQVQDPNSFVAPE